MIQADTTASEEATTEDTLVQAMVVTAADLEVKFYNSHNPEIFKYLSFPQDLEASEELAHMEVRRNSTR